jgi:petrobactin synthase
MKSSHCFLDAITSVIEGYQDPRPMLLGVWEADFVIKEQKITYFSDAINHDEYLERLNRLYGECAEHWYDYEQSKPNNFETLQGLLNSKQDEEYLVQLDLFYLPYEIRSYQKKHMPHFIRLVKEEERFFVTDPFLNFCGEVDEKALEDAFLLNELGGGIKLKTSSLKAPSLYEISKIFNTVFRTDNRLVTESLRLVKEGAKDRTKDRTILREGFLEIGILGKRKLSYLAAFSLFNRLTPEIENAIIMLSKGWTHLGFLAIKASMAKRELDINPILQKLHQLEQSEHKIKMNLKQSYEEWMNHVSV